MKEVFEESAYVVGNFETVCAGSENDFQDEFMLCNTPDQLIHDIKEGGINGLST